LEPFFGRLFLLVRAVFSVLRGVFCPAWCFLSCVVLFLVEVALGGNASWDFAGFS
jgi:hypothetical protein